ncbi:MAG: hypothetical protein ACYS7M_08405 [Planctomycetota bacterium]
MPCDDNQPESLRQRYVRELLRLYVDTPGVAGRVRQADRTLAETLFEQSVPLYAVANAFIVAAARRIRHNAYPTPPPPIQCLHYFRNVIREMLERPPGYREIEHLRQNLRQHH